MRGEKGKRKLLRCHFYRLFLSIKKILTEENAHIQNISLSLSNMIPTHDATTAASQLSFPEPFSWAESQCLLH